MPETHKQKGKWQLSGLKHCWSYVKTKISAKIQDWGTHCKFVCNNYNSVLSVRKKNELFCLSNIISIYISMYCIYVHLSHACIYLIWGDTFPWISHITAHVVHMWLSFVPTFFFFFSKDVYIENIIKDELSLLSKGHACSNPWKRVSPSGAMSRVAYCPL